MCHSVGNVVVCLYHRPSFVFIPVFKETEVVVVVHSNGSSVLIVGNRNQYVSCTVRNVDCLHYIIDD